MSAQAICLFLIMIASVIFTQSKSLLSQVSQRPILGFWISQFDLFQFPRCFLKTKINRAFKIEGSRQYSIVSFAEIDPFRYRIHSSISRDIMISRDILLCSVPVELQGFFNSEFYTVHLDIYLILYPDKVNQKYLRAFSQSFELKVWQRKIKRTRFICCYN